MRDQMQSALWTEVRLFFTRALLLTLHLLLLLMLLLLLLRLPAVACTSVRRQQPPGLGYTVLVRRGRAAPTVALQRLRG